MKPYRNLIYILSIIFIVGIVWVCFADPASVMSRIATGLITGAFVGAINMFVNYMHLRTSFFEKMISALTKIGHELGKDYIEVVLKNEELEKSSCQEVIDEYKKRTTEQKKELRSKENKYEKLAKKIKIDAFSGIFPKDKDVNAKLQDLDEVLSNIKEMYARYRSCPYFKSLPARASEEKQSLMIGDEEQFFNDWVQSNKDFQVSVANSMKGLGVVCKELSKSLTGTISKDASSVLAITSQYFRDSEINGLDTLEDDQDFDMDEDVNQDEKY